MKLQTFGRYKNDRRDSIIDVVFIRFVILIQILFPTALNNMKALNTILFILLFLPATQTMKDRKIAYILIQFISKTQYMANP